MLGQNTAGTTYGDGGATTRSTGTSFPSGNDELLNFFRELARRQMAQAQRPRQPQGGPMLGGAGRHVAPVEQRQERPGPGPQQFQPNEGIPMTYENAPFWGGQLPTYDRSRLSFDQLRQIQDWPRFGVGTKAETPTAEHILGAVGGGSSGGPAPAIDDQAWRQGAFAAQFPDAYAAALAANKKG